MSTKATLAQIRARVPGTDVLADDVVQAALDDAAALIDDKVFGARTISAHCFLAAHYLAVRTGSLGGEAGQVTAVRAGETSASFAAAGNTSERLASTKWGRLYLSIAETVSSMPITDTTEWFLS